MALRILGKSRETIVVRSFLVLSKKDRSTLSIIVLAQVFLGILDLAAVALMGVVGSLTVSGIANGVQGDSVKRVLELINLINLDVQEQVALLALLASILLISKTLLSAYFVRKTYFFMSRRASAISTELISKVMKQPIAEIHAKSSQETLFSVTNGVQALVLGVLSNASLLISDLSLVIILSIGLLIVDPILALSTVCFFGVVSIVLYRSLRGKAHSLGRLMRVLGIENNERILEILRSYREIVIRNRQSFYANEIGRLQMRIAAVRAESNFMPLVSKYVIEIMVVLGALTVAAIQFALNDSARAVAVMFVFIAASSRIAPAILRLQNSLLSFKQTRGTAAPTLDLIEKFKEEIYSVEIPDSFSTDHKGFEPTILVKQVSVIYEDGSQPVLSGVNLEIGGGTFVALVGPSGGGKTTLVDVILGIREANLGEVRISGVPPSESCKTWPGAIGYVPQEVAISNASIVDNVALGYSRADIDEKLVWDALETAQLKDFVKTLPQGLDTNLGERGLRLSGGQRQRLGLARALLTKPKLLVLDEATSALDSETEFLITEAVTRLRGDATILIVAHRLSTVRGADTVIYLGSGNVIASGKFEEVKRLVPEFARQANLMGV